MSHKKITEIISFVGNGVTKPLRCKLNDNSIAIFKTYNNEHGNRILANEYVSYHIAKTLNLEIPLSGVANLDHNTFISNDFSKIFGNNLSHHFGLGFFSTSREKVSLLTCSAALSKQENQCDIPKIILFDHLICNKDRNPGNLLIDIKKGEKKICIIDHSHVFSHGSIWDAQILKRLIKENDYLDNEVMIRNKYIYDMLIESRALDSTELLSICADFKNKLTDKILYDIIESVPSIWGISNTEGQHLYDYIMYRLNSLECIASLILDKGGV